MPVFSIQSRINPPGSELGTINAVMGGRGRHLVEKFEGPLSVKFMARGTGIWRTPEKLFRVEEGNFLVLNARQTYALHFPGGEPHESFCPFFRDGFLEDIARTATTAEEALLDDPDSYNLAEYPEHLFVGNTRVTAALGRIRDVSTLPSSEIGDLEDAFRSLARALLQHLMRDLASDIARLPAVKHSTRVECHRRLLRARDFMHAHAFGSLDVERIAKEAALSPHHFHRLFRNAFGEPPHRYLVRMRLERAARLLARTGTPVTDIAAKSGFESPGSFSTRFAKEYGLSPTAYRIAKTRKNEEAAVARLGQSAPRRGRRHP